MYPLLWDCCVEDKHSGKSRITGGGGGGEGGVPKPGDGCNVMVLIILFPKTKNRSKLFGPIK